MIANDLREHVVVCIGHGSEYSLRTLAAKLSASGLNCVEIDTIEPGWREMLPHVRSFKRRTLLSSQHPYLNKRAWAHFYKFDTDIIDLPEAVDLIAPERVFYIPHDLGFPIKDDETIALAQVTAALMPSDAFWYLRRVTKVFNVGWIGNLGSDISHPLESANKLAFLPSEIGYYLRRGIDHFLKTFDAVLGLQPTIKLPVMDGVEPLEHALRKLGHDVLPARISAGSLINSSEIVISNGLSSIVFEAHSRGRRTICLIDGSQPEALQRDYFSALSELALIPPDQVKSHTLSVLNDTALLKDTGRNHGFDYNLVLKLITEDL
jgi:hypothetical protein